VSLSGSVIAWAKLDGRIGSAWRFPGQRICNGLVFAAALALGAVLVASPSVPAVWPALFFAAALAFGVLMTLPIGGADMPVVISLYNAFTGLAVGLEGFALQNPALMIAGMVVGSAGTLLTLLMARAMNRSLANVLFSNFGDGAAAAQGEVAGRMTSVDAGDAAATMRYAASVIVVPGYGLAVAQAQGRLYELVKLLQAAGVDVKFAIHPVAGRMPGHMNVLLAEAGVPYDLIYDMEDINDSFAGTDVALVIGANDVVNPAARTDKSSPIYGMPILDADRARQVYVIKRGQGKGYAGVENLLFYGDNCDMVYGDAAAVLAQMVQSVKELAG
ncbi:MAG TPA: NAD(P) transhydrogenase subunit beta, partial [Xanthomonadaceae bacterium]|nr:NAD(P) transhydrogenase subunit beta [Xanthomonadaceae bacterium]